MAEGMVPTEIKGGVFLLISGLLLITPGFTDCVDYDFLKPVQDFIALERKIILFQKN